MTLHACIEAGGTKLVVALAHQPDAILAETRIATTTPAETLGAAVAWLRANAAEPIAAVGIASFGPVARDPADPQWGHITRTPKPGWSGTDMVRPFARAFDCPVGFDTDVNAAAIAEHRWGAAQGADTTVYVTVGTGIGGGAVIDGQPLPGAGHAEMGHMRVQRHPADTDFAGTCPFHRDCLEGLASGPAIHARWGAPLSDLPRDHIGHTVIADYLAQLAINLVAVLAPTRIMLGGGVLATPGLLDAVRVRADALAAGYFRTPPSQVIVAPGLGTRSGILGALALAQDVLAGA